MNLQEIRNKPREWKVLDSTYTCANEAQEMIGDIYAERMFCVHYKTVLLCTKDKSDFWTFNLSDVQEMTPLSYKGTRIGIGDEVKYIGNWYEVFGYIWGDDEWVLLGARDKNYNDTWTISEDNIYDHKPLHSPKETIIIGGMTYDKKEVEDCLKDLKAL